VLHWSADDWHTTVDTRSNSTSLGVEYADISVEAFRGKSIVFTFLWVGTNAWEGRDYRVSVV
jgi:hypothetical protein